MSTLPVNAMTCDVEDYFQVSAFEGLIPRSRWLDVECRIPRNVDRALQLFSDYDAKATFFTLGWVAQHYPTVVRRIVDEGHEIASHGMFHHRVTAQSSEEFRADCLNAKVLLEDTTGKRVTGYRAASWSINNDTPWAHEVLADCGYLYSSSVYPVNHDYYGVPDAPRQPYNVADLPIVEVPPSTFRFFGRNIPVSGGGYFRLYPLAVSKFAIRRTHARESSPYMFYFHPWELDPAQPRLDGVSMRARFRHYLNLDKFEARLSDLLKNFRWDRMDRLYLTDHDVE